jgi:MFS transporter, MHS family, proline/betaine transporter
MLGNFLEHYDKALFGLLAPCLASLFFADLPFLAGIIATYAIAFLGIITYPLGALFFGRIGDRKGRRAALFFTMMGMAVVTVCMGCLPTSQQAGPYAWVFLAVLRSLQFFFIAGESKGSAIFLLEQTQPRKRGWMSSLCDASSMLGTLVASALITIFASCSTLEQSWRWLFWMGGATAIAAIVLRMSARQDGVVPHSLKTHQKKERLATTLFQQRKPLFAIALACGFGHMTYIFAFTFMTSFVPLVTEFKAIKMLELNTLLLVFDMLCLPLFGLLTRKVSGFKMMGWAALATGLLAFPLFSLLLHPTETNIFLIRVIIVLLGVAFAAPFHMWALTIVPMEHRYTVISFGCAIGAKLIGLPGLTISFWLYHKTGAIMAPAAYLCITGLLAALAIWKTVLQPSQLQEQQA